MVNFVRAWSFALSDVCTPRSASPKRSVKGGKVLSIIACWARIEFPCDALPGPNTF